MNEKIMKKNQFLEIFENKEDVAYNFGIDMTELINVDIVVAYYSCEDYSGDAYVLLEKDGAFYEVHGSHCSCYGLEDQWDPELIGDEETLIKYLQETKKRVNYNDELNVYNIIYK